MTETPEDRRPIATRERKFSQRLANTFAGWGISANAISVGGLFCGLVAGVALWATSWDCSYTRLYWVAGALLVQGRLLANMLDGMVAERRGENSPIGALYNEVPDRIEDAAILIGLGYAVGGLPQLGYLAAIAAVFTAYVRAMNKVAGAPQDFCGPFAKPQRMFVVTLTAIYCAATPTAWQSLVIAGHTWGVPAVVLLVVFVGSLATAARRLVRAAHSLSSSE